MSRTAGFRTVTLCAMAALIAASAPPQALAISPVPDAQPSMELCQAVGFDNYGRDDDGRSYRVGMAAPSMAGPPPPPPPVANSGAEALIVTAQKRERSPRDGRLSKPVPPPSPMSPPIIAPSPYPYGPPPGTIERDRYPDVASNAIKQVASEPVSTFSIDVDTASYANVRSFLNDNRLPPSDAVRVEEMINYFDYGYAAPAAGSDRPFEAFTAVVPSPWSKDRQILHVGLQGRGVEPGKEPPLNLVFLVDTSGSMSGPDRLPLATKALNVLIDQLKPQDRVAMVAYAGSAGAVLAPTSGREKLKMRCALGALHAGGSTAGGQGLALAYALAEQNFRKDAVNRVILLTDGDFNVGVTDTEKLEDFVAAKRKTGVYLSVYGFGRGNYNDVMMQTLAQSGNGTAAYIDTLEEGRKVFRDDFTASLFPIADDVKIQIEFNPAMVSEYRLIGYETRMLNREDFNNDRVDAGEVGAGASVTALYEITPVGAAPSSDPLRYGAATAPRGPAGEYAYLKIRYKQPGGQTSQLMSQPITAAYPASDAPESTRWAMAVAAFGQKLRGDPWLEAGYGWDDVERLAQGARGVDEFGLRAQFVTLVRAAKGASGVNE